MALPASTKGFEISLCNNPDCLKSRMYGNHGFLVTSIGYRNHNSRIYYRYFCSWKCLYEFGKKPMKNGRWISNYLKRLRSNLHKAGHSFSRGALAKKEQRMRKKNLDVKVRNVVMMSEMIEKFKTKLKDIIEHMRSSESDSVVTDDINIINITAEDGSVKRCAVRLMLVELNDSEDDIIKKEDCGSDEDCICFSCGKQGKLQGGHYHVNGMNIICAWCSEECMNNTDTADIEDCDMKYGCYGIRDKRVG